MRRYFGNIKLSLLCFCICFIAGLQLMAQTNYQLPPNQPEQDACNALQLCGGSFFTPYSYTGSGKKLDLDATPCSLQPGGGETNSVWLRIHVASAGSIVFKIQPVNPTDDYNFAVLNATGKDCGSVTLNDVVRCNYSINLPGGNTNGITGLADTSRTPFIPPSFIGWAFAQPVFAKAGDTYLIMINNDGNPAAGGSNKGFTIDFNGSAATFIGTPNPQLNTVDEQCSDTKSIIIKLNEPVLCSSIAADGSDFTSDAPASIVSASAVNCTDRGGYTSSILINFSSALPAGNYTISAKTGSDNNTLRGLCGNDLTLPSDPVPFVIKPGSKVAMDNESVCFQQLPYIWNGITVNNAGNSVATYTSKASAGCDSITILNLVVGQPPQQQNLSANICDGDFYILPWDSTVTNAGTYRHHYLNSSGCDSIIENLTLTVFVPPSGSVQTRDSTIQTGFCQYGSILLDGGKNFVSYLWNTGQTSQSIIVTTAGAYSVLAKDQYGCNTIDTFAVAAYPRPTADFGTYAYLCSDSTVILDGGNYLSYLWEDGSTAKTTTTNQPGVFWVRLTDAHNCQATDSVTVIKIERPANFLINSISKCNYQDAVLTSLNDYARYAWSNGYVTKSIKVSKVGLYWCKVTDDHGCTGMDSTSVIDLNCPVYFFIPTAFSPNNDGLNDIFKPKFAGPLSGFQLSIYNRWGQLIFSSKDPFSGWDGTLSGYKEPTGVYIWICSYSLNGQSTQTEKGTVTLIR